MTRSPSQPRVSVSASHIDTDDIYRLPQYQSQPADLSLNSEQFDSQQLFFRPPAGSQPHDYDNYYGDSGAGPSYSGDHFTGGPPGDSGYTDQCGQDYYNRSLYTGYDDNGMSRHDDTRMYDMATPGYRYHEHEQSMVQYPSLAPVQPQPPPLHPSPAVLLHIKYVMESVCESMCFTDVTIITSSDTLRAHRSILSAHSTFLNYILSTNTDLQEDPVVHFPSYSSLYVRMLLQFFYTGEVTTMTQKDIEPLREICYSLGISSLMTRLDDVKLSISFQNIPSYDSHIPSVEQDENLENKPDSDTLKATLSHQHHQPLRSGRARFGYFGVCDWSVVTNLDLSLVNAESLSSPKFRSTRV